jgi:hypothetical protein
MLSQPHGQRLGVRDAALPEPGVGADLTAKALRAAGGEVERRKVAGRGTDLASEMHNGVAGQLVCSPRETPTPEPKLQQRREPQPRRPGLGVQQVQLVAD